MSACEPSTSWSTALPMSCSRPGALGDLHVGAELGGHETGEVGDLDRVVEHVLPVAGAELEAPEGLDELGRHPVHVGVEAGLLAGLLHGGLDLGLGLRVHLLDARRVDAAVGDELGEREPRDLATHTVEAREHDGLGGVVDDAVDAGDGLERADVAPLAADDAALHVVGRQRHDGHRGLGHVIRRRCAGCSGRGCCARGGRPRAAPRPRPGARAWPCRDAPRPRPASGAARAPAPGSGRRCARERRSPPVAASAPRSRRSRRWPRGRAATARGAPARPRVGLELLLALDHALLERRDLCTPVAQLGLDLGAHAVGLFFGLETRLLEEASASRRASRTRRSASRSAAGQRTAGQIAADQVPEADAHRQRQHHIQDGHVTRFPSAVTGTKKAGRTPSLLVTPHARRAMQRVTRAGETRGRREGLLPST
jgi:hypothetical protein